MLACLGAMLLLQTNTFAQNIKVAIAANLQPVIKALQADFKKQTNISIDAISGASGNLATQIKNGAPFDVFLSADVAFPAGLYKAKLAAQPPVVYAQGILVMCSTKKTGNASWEKIITSAKVKRIAIANPAIAPYGKAAEEALKHEGIYNQVKPKLITGESISQVNTYISTGSVEAGFTSLSFFKENSSKFPLVAQTIDPKIYAPIEQGMVILKHGQNNADAAKFYRYILSAPAKKILVQYGYHVQ
ncbi:molybdate ABC transporter substrate-binding protein [Mucilaginibacter sp. ZB1P21]|uniref:Molybdate ABC transporter substrate-binding protein n=2 Tax=Mucilaginibacter glaciei TaxID=2772109 RepID=A0A926NPY7_9SPHI|nr:molybdate ABC transporter substrate-binding protein [Mucilaginibacter glaciei]